MAASHFPLELAPERRSAFLGLLTDRQVEPDHLSRAGWHLVLRSHALAADALEEGGFEQLAVAFGSDELATRLWVAGARTFVSDLTRQPVSDDLFREVRPGPCAARTSTCATIQCIRDPLNRLRNFRGYNAQRYSPSAAVSRQASKCSARSLQCGGRTMCLCDAGTSRTVSPPRASGPQCALCRLELPALLNIVM